jgi:uncharacterized glyoxalase superfamily protein PhnB
MKNPPNGWPRISSSIFYDDAAAAIDWLVAAFGFEVRLKVEGGDGSIVHSELTLDSGVIMVGSTHLGESDAKYAYRERFASPRSLGGKSTQSLCAYIDDVDGHCEKARAAGAEIFREPNTDDYGEAYWADRTYGCRDLEGHQWFFMQRIREPGMSG